jgi:hypothetical protein
VNVTDSSSAPLSVWYAPHVPTFSVNVETKVPDRFAQEAVAVASLPASFGLVLVVLGTSSPTHATRRSA